MRNKRTHRNVLIALSVTAVAVLSLGMICLLAAPLLSPHVTTIDGDDKSVHVDCTEVFRNWNSMAKTHLTLGTQEALRVESHLTSGSVKITCVEEAHLDKHGLSCPTRSRDMYASGTRAVEWLWGTECDMTLVPSSIGWGSEPIDGTIDILLVEPPKDEASGFTAIDCGGGTPAWRFGDVIFGKHLISFSEFSAALAYAGYPDRGLSNQPYPYTYCTVEDEAPYPVFTVRYDDESARESDSASHECVIQKARGHEMGWYYPFENTPGTSHEKQLIGIKSYKTPYGQTEVKLYGDYWSHWHQDYYLKWSLRDEDGIEWQYQARLPSDNDGEEFVATLG